jgi:hypothetical protein
VSEGCHLKNRRGCGKDVREIVVGYNVDVAATRSLPVTFDACRFLVV